MKNLRLERDSYEKVKNDLRWLTSAGNSMAEYKKRMCESALETIEALLEDRDIVARAEKYLANIEWSRFFELIEADKAGRLLILPSKQGDPVYRIYDDCVFPGDCGTKRMCKGCEYRNLFIEEQAFCLSMLQQNGELGRPYYMTREEAEAALAKEG